MGDKLAIGFFCLWFLVSLLVYVPKLTLYIRSLDVFSLVPEWKFFAPTPGQGDYHLLYRDRFADGSVTDWTEVPVAEERGWWNFMWNPGRRGRKALFDAVMELGLHARERPELPLAGSIPYLTLLNYVSELARPVPVALTQFLVMYSHGTRSEEEPEVAVLSGVHSL